MPSNYISRPIANAILSDHHKVVIIEGARAVGKTTLVQNQLANEGYAYRTLADDEAFHLASSNPSAWFKTLPDRVIIDEAQRIKELPLLIKEAVDKSTAFGPQYILTGSASIGRSSLDGQDPLVRRAGRYTISPLTQREVGGIQRSIIDDLWNGTPNESFQGDCSRDDLARLMSIGGFPQYVSSARIISSNERSLSIRADIANILGATVIPGEQLDSTIANEVLRAVLALPGCILNVNRIAQATGRNPRTVTSYLSVLTNRFLIRPLRNQKLSAAKQAFTRSKIHPVDPSFSIEAFLRSGKDVITDSTHFGYIFESFVASQLLPAIEWSSIRPDAFFWREAGSSPKEVDFVFMHNGKSIGVEVKASNSVDRSDFKNLQALSMQQELARGFVIYTGSAIVHESENMWAIPVDALWRSDAFKDDSTDHSDIEASARSLLRITSETPGGSSMGMTSAANIFLSYNHDDNKHLDNGIIQFLESVKDEYEFSYGETLSLFVDTRSIKWGEDWRKALDRGIEATNFLMPAITPRYVQSASCRDELFKFLDRMEGSSNGHVLSMVWRPINGIDLEGEADTARQILESHQYLQLTELRDLTPSDRAYKATVRKAAEKLHEAIEAQEIPSLTLTKNKESSTGEDAEGLLEQLDAANENINLLQSSITQALNDVDRIANTMKTHPAPSSSKPGIFSAWGAEIAKSTQDDVSHLNGDLDNVEQAWASIRKFMSSYIEIAPALGPERQDDAMGSLQQLRQQIQLPENIDMLSSQIGMLQSFSPKLKPLAKAMKRLIDTIKGIISSVDELASAGD